MAVNMLQLLTPSTGGQGEDFTTLERRKQAMALAQELMKDSMSTAPIQSHWQGAAKLAQALVGGMMEQRERGKEAADQKSAFDALFGGAGQSAPTGSSASDALPKAPSPSSSPMGALPGMDGAPESRAIASIESGGKYDLLGPVTRTGDRAHGKYQVMGANIGPWTKEALGQEMDAKTFLASPEAQEAVFKAKFGQYQSKYGPEGAARAWFAGEGGMNDMGRKDQLGTSVAAYANKFNQGMARASAPQQVASLGGATTNEAPQSAVPVTGSASPPVPHPPQQMAQAQVPQPGQAQAAQRPQLPAPFSNMSQDQLRRAYANPYLRPMLLNALQKQELKPHDAGDKVIFYDSQGNIRKEVPKQLSTDDLRELDAENKSRAARGEQQMSPLEFIKTVKQAGATNVQLSTEKKGQELLVSKAIDGFENANKAAMDANKRIAAYGQLAQAAQAFTPGATADVQLQASRVLKDLGIIKGDNVAPAEQFKAIQRRLELAATPRGQGQITENERALIRETIPGITNSPESISSIIGSLEQLDKYDLAVARIYRDNAKVNGGIPNYLQVSEEISKLGSPLTDDQLVSLRTIQETGRAAKPDAAQPQQSAPISPGRYRYDPQRGLVPVQPQ